jgi:AraC-like DNA-binding protein
VAMADHSQLGSLITLLVKTLDRRGLDSLALLQRAGIDPAALPVADGRVPAAKVDRLWQEIMQASNNDFSIAVEHAQSFNLGNLHVLGFGLYASANLIEASERIARAMRIISGAPQIDCQRSGGEFHVTTTPTYPGAAPQKQLVFLSVLLGVWRSLLHPAVVPLRVELTNFDEPSDPVVRERLEDLFGCPVHYNQKLGRISLTLELAQTPLPQANAELAARGDAVVASYLAQMDRSDIVTAVVNQIAEGCFDKLSVARRLGVSPSTLQRRLAEENQSFSELLISTRRDLAAMYLRSGQYAVKEVSYLLGYADPANLSRAFRTWYGIAPEAFRNQPSARRDYTIPTRL